MPDIPAPAHVVTLGDLLAKGMTHLEVRCACGRVTLFPLRVAIWPCGQPVETMADKFRCDGCGKKGRAGIQGCRTDGPERGYRP